jgi:hypothetical protein
MYFSFCLLLYGAKFLCPIPTEEELEKMKKNIIQEDQEIEDDSEDTESDADEGKE